MNQKYYVGSYRDDSLNEPNHGWIVGKFKDAVPRKNNEVEIKYWEFKVGLNDHPAKESAIIECTFILSGKAKGFIGDNEVILQAGDYIVIQPGTPNNIVAEILEPTSGLTIKAPSDPTAKKILD
jgi:mannose-6-phosphate isomerase-like protein (cupin superfamily)